MERRGAQKEFMSPWFETSRLDFPADQAVLALFRDVTIQFVSENTDPSNHGALS